MRRPTSVSIGPFPQKSTSFLEQRVPVTFIRGRTKAIECCPESSIYFSTASGTHSDQANRSTFPKARFTHSATRRTRSRRPSTHTTPACAFRNTWRSCRNEEHTSELQSRGHLVCRLLLEKKKKK